MKRISFSVATAFLILGVISPAAAKRQQAHRFVIDRKDRTITLEPYGSNIVRVTLSSDKSSAIAAPGYGIVGTPSSAGWTHEQDGEGYDVFRSSRIVIRLAPENLPGPHPMPLDELNQKLRSRYF